METELVLTLEDRRSLAILLSSTWIMNVDLNKDWPKVASDLRINQELTHEQQDVFLVKLKRIFATGCLK